MVWRSGRYQVFLIFDDVLTAMAGLIVATFIHKDWDAVVGQQSAALDTSRVKAKTVACVRKIAGCQPSRRNVP